MHNFELTNLNHDVLPQNLYLNGFYFTNLNHNVLPQNLYFKWIPFH